MNTFKIETPRLILREWREDDAVVHNRLRNDPRVAETLGAPVTLDRSRESVARQRRHMTELGFCLWVVEQRHRPGMIGWCGMQPGPTPIEPDIEIGWTLHPALWGQGLATEAARACLDWAWSNTPLPRIAAITSMGNSRSRNVMLRLGMQRVEHGDFDHPALSQGDPLRRHVLYRISRPR